MDASDGSWVVLVMAGVEVVIIGVEGRLSLIGVDEREVIVLEAILVPEVFVVLEVMLVREVFVVPEVMLVGEAIVVPEVMLVRAAIVALEVMLDREATVAPEVMLVLEVGMLVSSMTRTVVCEGFVLVCDDGKLYFVATSFVFDSLPSTPFDMLSLLTAVLGAVWLVIRDWVMAGSSEGGD